MRPGPLVLLLITVLFFWKLTLTGQYTWLNNPDMSNQVAPWVQFQATEWHGGRFPLWDHHHWGGQSLIGQDQPGAAYPLNWLLFLAPLRKGYVDKRYPNFYFVHSSTLSGKLWALPRNATAMAEATTSPCNKS